MVDLQAPYLKVALAARVSVQEHKKGVCSLILGLFQVTPRSKLPRPRLYLTWVWLDLQTMLRHERIMLQFFPIILLRIAQKFPRLFSIKKLLFSTFFDIFTDL